MDENNWFQKAARDAEASERGREAFERAQLAKHASRVQARAEAEEQRRRERLAATTSREAEAARRAFEAVVAGKAPMLGTGPSPWGAGGYARGGYVPGRALPTTPVGAMRPPRTRIVYDNDGNDVSMGIGTGRFPKPTPAEGLLAILDAVRKAGDPDAQMKVAGEWITKVTNGISAIIREADTPNE